MTAKVLKYPPMCEARELPCRHGVLADWMETHTRILGFWMDRLIEDGDSEDLVSMLHRQHTWLALMQDRLGRG